MKKILQGEELSQRARDLGIDIQGDARSSSSSGSAPRAPDYELQRRVAEAERSRRESSLWLMALISAVASVISAITAWIAVAK
jgi:hypothetical protein